MRKIFKLPSETIWVADPHIYHNRDFVYKLRGFNDIFEHADWFRRELNQYHLANPNAVCVLLGDYFLNTRPEEAKSYLSSISIPTIFAWGNHNACMSDIFKEINGDKEVYPTVWRNITFVGDSVTVVVDKQTVFCSHFAHEIWDKSHHGVWHAHGHSHHSFVGGHRNYLESKRLDVGVDSCVDYFGKPYITFAQLKEIMDKKSVAKLDHHNRETT